MEFAREKTLLHKLMVVDGVGKCGKSLLMNMATAFETVEKIEYNQSLEIMGFAYHYQKISRDMAITILRSEIDTSLYNNMIGRNINTRLGDDTSLFKYHTPEKYLKRALDTDGSVIAQKVFEEKPIYLCWSHDLIHKSDIIFEAFSNRLAFLYMNRRPIDIIYEWGKANYSNRMASDPTEMQYCIKYKDTVVPQIAYGWEEEYLHCTETERTVKMVSSFLKKNCMALCEKQKLENLHVFNFEDLLTDPAANMKRLGQIIGTQPLSDIMKKILQNANCPRKIDETVYREREKNIKNNISKPYLDLLPEMNAMYEEIYKMALVVECNVTTVL